MIRNSKLYSSSALLNALAPITVALLCTPISHNLGSPLLACSATRRGIDGMVTSTTANLRNITQKAVRSIPLGSYRNTGRILVPFSVLQPNDSARLEVV